MYLVFAESKFVIIRTSQFFSKKIITNDNLLIIDTFYLLEMFWVINNFKYNYCSKKILICMIEIHYKHNTFYHNSMTNLNISNYGRIKAIWEDTIFD